MSNQINQRNFLKEETTAGLGIAVGSVVIQACSNSPILDSVPTLKIASPLKKARMGFVGVGEMGAAHVRNFLKIEGIEIVAVCDFLESRATRSQKLCEEIRKGASHGGMDFIEDYHLINALLKGIEPDMDVYDTASISVVTDLSEQSIANNGAPIKLPYFTWGMWKNKRDLMVDKV